MTDDLLTTVKAWLRKLDTRLIATKQPETDTLAVILEDLPCTVSGWLRALLARCEAAEARVRELSEHHAFEVVDPVGGPVAAPCAIEGCRYAELVAERDAARAKADRTDAILRQLAKDGRLWIDQKDLLNARVRLVYEPEHQPEIAAARAEVARLRDLLLDGLSHGIDDYWITTAEGVEWRERVKAALDTPAREGGDADS